jgi:hypothetical protein
VISRYLLIVLAVGAGVYRAVQGAGLASAGMFALAGGLVVLKWSERKPAVRPFAYLCFVWTAASIALFLIQRR